MNYPFQMPRGVSLLYHSASGIMFTPTAGYMSWIAVGQRWERTYRIAMDKLNFVSEQPHAHTNLVGSWGTGESYLDQIIHLLAMEKIPVPENG